MVVTINVMDNDYKWNIEKVEVENEMHARIVSDVRSSLLNKKLNNGMIKDYFIVF